MDLPNDSNNYQQQHVDDLNNSFKQLLGKPCFADIKEDDNFAKAVFHAPIAVLSHNGESEPLFNYANLKALELFGYQWHELIGLPSKLSAEADTQPEREQLLAQAAKFGFSENYHGVRISKSGQRFSIKNAVIWNVHDAQGRIKGQAACFSSWDFL
ncbi:MEKHLA domain-containing protein [Methylosoma difficile]